MNSSFFQKLSSPPIGPRKVLPWQAILLALAWPAMGLVLCMLVEMVFKIKLSRLERGLIGLVVSGLGAVYLFPKIYQVPFPGLPLREYFHRLGFYLPKGAWRHALLGVVLAACTLGGMLAASLLTGRYVLDWSQVNLGQFVFSLNPGIFEEFFYRGMLVIVLLPLTQSVTRAMAIQIVLFGLAHIKGFEPLALFDVISVMVLAITFTYAAYKTRALLAGIVFHILHDALIFFVQVPSGTYQGLQENLLFYGLLWLMVAVACLIIRFAAERLQIRADQELYVR